MERATGLEPVSSAWKAKVLATRRRPRWQGRQDLNPHCTVLETDRLPLSYSPVLSCQRNRYVFRGDRRESNPQRPDSQSGPGDQYLARPHRKT
jgi:hypothetical protein